MSNFQIDASNFSEQLGIYDFFNVLLSGTIFIYGLCVINSNFNNLLWCDLSFQKILGLVLLIYIIGMILQELGSLADRYIFKIYKGSNQSILRGILDNAYKCKTSNKIVSNPILLERYRKSADKLIKEFIPDHCADRFENKYVSGFIFSVCQYYVAINGKDKKIEKLRALFAMSKTLIVCFFLLAIVALLSIIFTTSKCEFLNNIPTFGCEICSGKVILSVIFTIIGFIFYLRAKRTMRNFLLILLGTYDAIVRNEDNKHKIPKPDITHKE